MSNGLNFHSINLFTDIFLRGENSAFSIVENNGNITHNCEIV